MTAVIQAYFSLNAVGIVLWSAGVELRILLRSLRDGVGR